MSKDVETISDNKQEAKKDAMKQAAEKSREVSQKTMASVRRMIDRIAASDSVRDRIKKIVDESSVIKKNRDIILLQAVMPAAMVLLLMMKDMTMAMGVLGLVIAPPLYVIGADAIRKMAQAMSKKEKVQAE